MADNAADPERLHKAVWRNDAHAVRAILLEEYKKLKKQGIKSSQMLSEDKLINQRDRMGNPPLHLAIHLRNKEMIDLLLQLGADILIKNGGGYTTLQEAMASGDRIIVRTVLDALRAKVKLEYDRRMPELAKAIAMMPNFTLTLKWEFKSWVPLVSCFCPYDTYTIWKRGSSFRIDTTLVGFSNMKWQRGNVSFFFLGSDTDTPAELVIVNHDKKIVDYALADLRLHDEVSTSKEVELLLRQDIIKATSNMECAVFTPKKGFWGSPKTEVVEGKWNSKVFALEGLEYAVTRRISSAMEEMTIISRNASHKVKIRKPDDIQLTYEQYFDSTRTPPSPPDAPSGSQSPLKRNIKGTGMLYPSESTHTKRRAVKGKVWLSSEFPRNLRDLMPVFEVLSPTNKHFEKLENFLKLNMPVNEGFPVKLEVPVFPTVTATATFMDYTETENIDPALFQIPSDYLVRIDKSGGVHAPLDPIEEVEIFEELDKVPLL